MAEGKPQIVVAAILDLVGQHFATTAQRHDETFSLDEKKVLATSRTITLKLALRKDLSHARDSRQQTAVPEGCPIAAPHSTQHETEIAANAVTPSDASPNSVACQQQETDKEEELHNLQVSRRVENLEYRLHPVDR
jgi:hypothetical protein